MAENNFDKLLGRNGELVEERKKQVLAGALGIVQRYCEETPNKMEVVAKLFNKKMGERFTVEWGSPDFMFDCRFDEYGLYVLSVPPFSDYFRERLLYDLLKGRAVIKC